MKKFIITISVEPMALQIVYNNPPWEQWILLSLVVLLKLSSDNTSFYFIIMVTCLSIILKKLYFITSQEKFPKCVSDLVMLHSFVVLLFRPFTFAVLYDIIIVIMYFLKPYCTIIHWMK